MDSPQHLARLYKKPTQVMVVGGGGGTTTTPHPGTVPMVPPVKTTIREVVDRIPGIGEVVLQPNGMWATREALQVMQPTVPSLQTLPWKKILIGVGIAAGIGVAIYCVTHSSRQGSSLAAGSMRMPMGMPAGMESCIPPALMGIFTVIFLSKLLRGEFSGWTKTFKEWFKE